MNIYGATTETGIAYIIAATSVEQAYDIACKADEGYVDFDGVHQLNIQIPEKHKVMDVVENSCELFSSELKGITDGLMEAFLDIPVGIIDQF